MVSKYELRQGSDIPYHAWGTGGYLLGLRNFLREFFLIEEVIRCKSLTEKQKVNEPEYVRFGSSTSPYCINV